jgi:nitroreductase
MTVPDMSGEALAALLVQRSSIRAYTAQTVEQALLEQLLRAARQAPSGSNLQPGGLVQVRGNVRMRMQAELAAAYLSGAPLNEDYVYCTDPMPGHLQRRRVGAARALYDSLGIARTDHAARAAQFARNFAFFDAPVALVVTIERRFGSGAYLDLGMVVYGLMLAAQAQGLATCAIGALAAYPDIVRRHLGLDTDTHIVCGLALGYADTAHPVNRTHTERCGLGDFFRVVE